MMRRSIKPPPAWQFLAGHTLFVLAFAAADVWLRGSDSLLILLIVPVFVAASWYPRRVYLAVICISMAVAIPAVAQLSADYTSSRLTIVLMAIATMISAEIILRQTAARARAQEALRERDARHQKIIGLTSDYVYAFAFDERGEPVSEWMTPAFNRITGYTPEELGTHGIWLSIIHPADRAAVLRHIAALRSGRSAVCTFRLIKRDGQVRWLREYAYPETNEHGITRVYGAGQDITEERHAQEQLRRQNDYLAALHETALGLLDRLDPVELLEDIVVRAARLLETPNGFLYLVDADGEALTLRVSRGVHMHHHGVRLGPGEGLAGRVWQTGEPLMVDDYSIWPGRSPQLNESLLRAMIGVPLVSNGRVVGVLGMAVSDSTRTFGPDERDILVRFAQLAAIALDNAHLHAGLQQALDARARAEAALRESEEYFRQIFEYAPIAIGISAPDGRLTRVNRAFCQTFGYTAEELSHMTISDLSEPEDMPANIELRKRMMAGEIERFVLEKRYVHKNGAIIIGELYTSLVRDADGRPLHVIGQVLDVTERREAERMRLEFERKLLETQKLESLGVLAGGIAHDFNNMLAVVLGNAGLALLDLPADHPVHAQVVQIERVARHAAALTRQLLDYTGRGRVEAQVLDLRELVSEMSTLLRASIGKKIALEQEFTPGLPPIMADAAQIRQVVMNLIVNASEAIGNQEGTIRVALARRVLTAADLAGMQAAAEAAPGEYVMLEVRDTGCGMDDRTMARIFEPFFTTKFTGRGLGLAAVQGIVRGRQGALQVQSAPGRGTVFRIFLPPACEPAAVPAPLPAVEPAAASPRDTPHGTVLIIDDEAEVRTVAQRLLERAGLRTLVAADGQEGLALFARQAETIDCVLLDLTMPRLDGAQTLRQLRTIRPDVPVLLMSGFTEIDTVEQLAGQPLAGFIQKPFTPADLYERVRRAMEAAPRWHHGTMTR
jgi:two-component system cell cycle sensor histidine kinase/response regulator CckA